MDDPTRPFYDDFAEYYHLIFQDWARSIEWQASVLGPLLECEMTSQSLRILDCACGIGTQALGLARRGHDLTGTDLSEAAVLRARREAQQRSLPIRFSVADMRDLSSLPETGFDVVLAVDNALPHLLDPQDLARQRAAFEEAGAVVAPTGARAALAAAAIVRRDAAIVDSPLP